MIYTKYNGCVLYKNKIYDFFILKITFIFYFNFLTTAIQITAF